jgi:hypothetical protein
MEADEAKLQRMRDEWCELDQAMIVTFQIIDPVGRWPWQSTHPRVVAAWEALTRPEHLPDLEFRLAYFNDGASMNDWAAAVTRKAIEVSRSREAE